MGFKVGFEAQGGGRRRRRRRRRKNFPYVKKHRSSAPSGPLPKKERDGKERERERCEVSPVKFVSKSGNFKGDNGILFLF